MEFRVLPYKEEVHEDYSLITHNHANGNKESVRKAYNCSSAYKEKERVRLKDGFLEHQGDNEPSIIYGYQKKIIYKLVGKIKIDKEMMGKDDCLIAVAYAAEHDDVKEVQELVKHAGREILSTRMPHAYLGTILHVCTNWSSLKTLESILSIYPHECFNVNMVDKDGDTALHNLANQWNLKRVYEDSKRAACLLLDISGVDTNRLLAKQNNNGHKTALCKALLYAQDSACEALLDAAKEKEEKGGPITLTGESAATSKDSAKEKEEKGGPITTGESAATSKDSHWLTSTIHGWQVGERYGIDDDDAFCTALHLAVLGGYTNIVTKILAYPGSKKLNLTNLPDHNGDSPLHISAKVRDPDICAMLLKYGMETGKDGGGVTSSNKDGESPLHIAASHGHAEVCEKLLEYGASLSLRDKHGRYPLTNAFARGHNEVVKILLDVCLPSTQAEITERSAKSKESLLNEHFESGLTPLHVAVAIASEHHMISLIKAGALVDSTSEDGRTPLHVATQQYNIEAVNIMLSDARTIHGNRISWINMRDVRGQTALSNVVKHSSTSCGHSTSEDQVGEITVADQYQDDAVVKVLLGKGAWVDVQDCNGETPLHEAARSRQQAVLKTLLSEARDTNFRRGGIKDRDKWISTCDFSGETALHEAARVGDLVCVHHLLAATKSLDDLLLVRDMENRTALDWAALNVDGERIMDEMMRCPGISDMTKRFLMWHLKEHIPPGRHAHFCKKYDVTENQSSLLPAAVENEDVDIARELINGGADVTALDDEARRWLAQNLRTRASDLPTCEDTLGRKELVQGVATLLLNPYTQIPLTIGIFGSWGIGKSSFMLQVEETMLHMAVKETFKKIPYSPTLGKESSMIKFSKIGSILRYLVVKALKQRMMKADRYKHHSAREALWDKLINPLKKSISHKDIENAMPSNALNSQEDDIIENEITMELQSKYHQLFKTLALTDRSKLVQSGIGGSIKRKVGMHNKRVQDIHLIAHTPAVLTLHYNAWQYDNKNEASAGLAVEISHQLERLMTPHQWLRMCWKHSWKTRPGDVFVHFLLPFLLAIIVVCVILVLWKWLPIATKYKSLSLPLGIVGVMWALFKTCLDVIQPVTQTMLNITKSFDHKSMLGYQHQVIDDINFLKYQLCEDANFGWKVLSFLCQFFISNSYFMENTWIWKQHPCLSNFRIVIFIDDLDRCDEKTILELLRAISLILGSCGINVVIGIDKEMAQRAIIREFLKDNGDNFFNKQFEEKVYAEDKVYAHEKGPEVVENVDEKTFQEKKESQNVGSSEIITNNNKYTYLCEITDNYLQKIIQLPIQMPEPSKIHIEHFIQRQVGQHISRNKKNKLEDSKLKVKESKQKGHISISIKKDIEYDEEKDVMDSQSKETSEKDAMFSQSKDINEKDVMEQKVKDEVDPHNQDGIKDGATKPIAFQLLLANYSPMEKDMVKRLSQLATTERRLPRELKRFFNYHRLAWTILSQDLDMKSIEFKGWQRKLILWIFICWNWKTEMDIIFQKWQDIIPKNSKWQAQMHLQGKDKMGDISLKLCDIIRAYMKSMEWTIKEDGSQNSGKKGGQEVPKAWSDLYKTLKEEYDIPMHFIEKFQQFRFYCVLNHLEIGEQFKLKKMDHLNSLMPIRSMLKLRSEEFHYM